jgi:hypothetical protein
LKRGITAVITLMLHLVVLYLCIGAAIAVFLHKVITDGPRMARLVVAEFRVTTSFA